MVRSYDRQEAAGGRGLQWCVFEDHLAIARCIRMSHRRLSEVRRRCLGPSREIIERAHARRVAAPADVATRLLEGVELTRRQEETLKLLLRGKSEKQAAAEMGLSRNTVHLYVMAIYRRLGVHSRTELLMRCLRGPQGAGAAVQGIARIGTNGRA